MAKDPECWTHANCKNCGVGYMAYKKHIAAGWSLYCTPICKNTYRQSLKSEKERLDIIEVLSVRRRARLRYLTRLKMHVKIVESFMSNPNRSGAQIGKDLNVSKDIVRQAIERYLRKPKKTIVLQSSIDSPRAIALEANLRLKSSTEVYEYIDGY